MKSGIYSQSEVDRLAGESRLSLSRTIGFAAILDTRASQPFDAIFGGILAAAKESRLHLYYDRFSLPCGYVVTEPHGSAGDSGEPDLLHLLDFQAKPGWLRLLAHAVLALGEAHDRRIVCPAGHLAAEAVEIARCTNDRIRLVAFEQSARQRISVRASARLRGEPQGDQDEPSALIFTPNAKRLRERAEATGMILYHLYGARRFPTATLHEVRRFALDIWNMGQFWIPQGGDPEAMILWGWLSDANLSASRVRACHQLHASELNEGENLCLLFASTRDDACSTAAVQQWTEAVAVAEISVFYAAGMLPSGLLRAWPGKLNMIPLPD